MTKKKKRKQQKRSQPKQVRRESRRRRARPSTRTTPYLRAPAPHRLAGIPDERTLMAGMFEAGEELSGPRQAALFLFRETLTEPVEDESFGS